MKNVTGKEYAAQKYIETTVKERALLLDFLMNEQNGLSRNRAKDILKGHGVQVDMKLVTQWNYELIPGQVVRISKHKRKTELQSQWIRIVYEDKDIIIVDKNPGILSAGNSSKQYCIKTILDEYFERRHFKCHAHVVHRLDRETSGLMVYAKSIEAAQILEHDWKQRVFDRRYVAIVEGVIEDEGATLESWLKDNKSFVTFSSPADNGGKLAITHFRVAARSQNETLVELKLETGRKNQIRVHMSDIGHPICGDEKYGAHTNPLHRLCLHAWRLFLYHPMTGERMEFETPFPSEFSRRFNINN